MHTFNDQEIIGK